MCAHQCERALERRHAAALRSRQLGLLWENGWTTSDRAAHDALLLAPLSLAAPRFPLCSGTCAWAVAQAAIEATRDSICDIVQ